MALSSRSLWVSVGIIGNVGSIGNDCSEKPSY
jgi:hypothetical protein